MFKALYDKAEIIILDIQDDKVAADRLRELARKGELLCTECKEQVRLCRVWYLCADEPTYVTTQFHGKNEKKVLALSINNRYEYRRLMQQSSKQVY
jgi:hypothetical protein